MLLALRAHTSQMQCHQVAEQTSAVLPLSKFNKMLFGYFYPENMFQIIKNKKFSGWASQYFGYKGSTERQHRVITKKPIERKRRIQRSCFQNKYNLRISRPCSPGKYHSRMLRKKINKFATHRMQTFSFQSLICWVLKCPLNGNPRLHQTSRTQKKQSVINNSSWQTNPWKLDHGALLGNRFL